MLGRRLLLGGALGAATLPWCGRGQGMTAVDARFRAVPKHLQVFRTAPSAWPEVAALCQKLGIATVAVSLPPAERQRLLADRAQAQRAFAPLAEAGLAVRGMVGEGAWARDHGDGPLPRPIEEWLAIHDTVFRFQALLLDVEPQVLPEWKRGERTALVRGTLALFARVRKACAARGLKLSAALAPWYTNTPDPGRPGANFLDGCLENLDEALVMAYRNRPEAVMEFARAALAALERRPIPSWIGLTTQANDAPGSTYAGLGAMRFMDDVTELHGRLKAGPAAAAISGIAIHQFATLRALTEG
jgi:hypothetical protein